MATIYDVCAKAGVSMATVSRVINGNDNVRKETRLKVEKAMTSLNYRPNVIAQSLASKTSNSVGILVSELSGPVFGPMMSGIEDELSDSRKRVVIASGHSDKEREKESIEILISRNCDALIMHVEAVSDEYLIELSKSSIPFVLINRFVPGLSENCITLDDYQGGYLATKALVDFGHTEIAYISGPLWKIDAQERLKGHKQALKDNNINIDNKLIFEGDYKRESGIAGCKYLLKYKEHFTGIVCANDEMASGAMVCARDENIELPEEMSIMGFDDINVASYLYPKLSTIHNPVNEMGKMAAKWVLKNVYHKNVDDIQMTFEPKLITRDSVLKIN